MSLHQHRWVLYEPSPALLMHLTSFTTTVTILHNLHHNRWILYTTSTPLLKWYAFTTTVEIFYKLSASLQKKFVILLAFLGEPIGSLNAGWDWSVCNRFPHTCTYSHTYKCGVPRHSDNNPDTELGHNRRFASASTWWPHNEMSTACSVPTASSRNDNNNNKMESSTDTVAKRRKHRNPDWGVDGLNLCSGATGLRK